MRGIRKMLRVTVLTMLLIGISTTGVPMRILGQDAKVALDVYLLVDQTGSFKDDNATFQNQAQSLLRDLFSNPALDLRVGLGIFRDYPIAPFGDRGDFVYRRLQDLSADIDAITRAIQQLSADGGGDDPEAQCAALFQAITGAGQDTNGDRDLGDPQDIPADQKVHFREQALRFIILWTDAPFHRQGDAGTYPDPAPGVAPRPRTQIDCTEQSNFNPIASLLGQNLIHVIGIFGSGSPAARADLEAIARETLTFAPSQGVDCNGDGRVDLKAGDPLVCPIASNGQGIAEAIKALVTPLVTLEAALRQKAITVRTFSKGQGPAGDIIGLEITNNLQRQLQIIVRRGTSFIDPNTGQVYVAKKSQEFSVEPKQSKRFDGVTGFALYADKDPSQAGTNLNLIPNVSFWLGEQPAKLAQKLKEIDEKNIPDPEGLKQVQDITKDPSFPRPSSPPQPCQNCYIIPLEIEVAQAIVVLRWEIRAVSDRDNKVTHYVQLIPSVERCSIVDNFDFVNRTGSNANDFEVTIVGPSVTARGLTFSTVQVQPTGVTIGISGTAQAGDLFIQVDSRAPVKVTLTAGQAIKDVRDAIVQALNRQQAGTAQAVDTSQLVISASAIKIGEASDKLIPLPLVNWTSTVANYYPKLNPKLSTIKFTQETLKDGRTLFKWQFNRDIKPGEDVHLGLWLWATDCANMTIKSLTWTKDGQVTGELPASCLKASSGQLDIQIVNCLNTKVEISNISATRVDTPIPLPALNAQDLPISLPPPVPGGALDPNQAMPIPLPSPNPVLVVEDRRIDWGSIPIGPPERRSFTISNRGGGILEGNISCSGDCSVFEFSPSSFRLAAGKTLQVQVTFQPRSVTSYSATLNISSNGGSASVSLQGLGYQPPPPPEFRVSVSAPSSPCAGETVTIKISVRNVGNGSGTADLELRIDGSRRRSWSLSLAPGGSTTVSESTSFSPGSHTVEARVFWQGTQHDADRTSVNARSGTFFAVGSLDAPPRVSPNQSFTVSTTIRNTGCSSGTQTIRFLVDGSQRDSTRVSLSAGGSTTVSFRWSFSSTGSYRVTIASDDDSSSTTINVGGLPTLTEWGLIALVVLLAGSLVFMIRRRFTPRPAGA
jgi:hypothetical protein